jgi:DMSO/TMAO reductase YedYZ molybdopterin-dependent catalytic subunit
MLNKHILTLFVLFLAACTPLSAQPAETDSVQVCSPRPITVPTPPAVIPGDSELDCSTGLHMTGTMQVVDFDSWRLKVSGAVKQPLELTYDTLRCLPKITARPELRCDGIFEEFTDVATWSGVPIAEVLKLAQPLPEAQNVVLVSADGYKMNIDLPTALDPQNYLAYEWEGEPLPVLHGFPLRAIFPDKSGANWVKWIVEIRVN